MRDYDDNRRPEEIESDIERTRAEVSSTIDAIQSKLTPGQLMDQAVAYARTSLPADFGSNLSNAVRDNPIPVALVGIGLAWLMASGRNADGQARQRRQAVRYAETDLATGEQQEGTMHRAASRIGETGRGLKDKTSEIGHRISDSTSAVTGRAREMGQGARERISAISSRSQQGYYRTRDSLSHMVDEQPLAVGALGLAVGTLLGALLPGTRREDEMMGEKRDQMVGRASEVLREQTMHAKETAQRAMDEKMDADRDKADGSRAQGAGAAPPSPPSTSGEQRAGGTMVGGAGQSPYGPH